MLDLIHDERNSMNPFEPAVLSADTTRTIEDLVKIGLVEYMHDKVLKGIVPTDDDLLLEAQKIISTADQNTSLPGYPEISWFRDLIMLSNTTEDDSTSTPSTTFLPWAKRLGVIAAQAPHTELETIQ